MRNPETLTVPAASGIEPRRRARSLAVLLWESRAVLAGFSALALATAGELLMRAGRPGPDGQPGAFPEGNTWGPPLVALAAILVLLVAWVRDDFTLELPWVKKRPGVSAEPALETEPAAAQAARPVPTRKRLAPAAPPGRARSRSGLAVRVREMTRRLPRLVAAARQTLGRRGTIGGLVVTAILGITVVWLLLASKFTSVAAAWLWVAMLAVLLLTFVGVRPWPEGRTLIAHDPWEPASEPRVTRIEWLVVAIILVAAAVLRLWDLSSIPAGPYVDESGRALDARYLNEGLPFNHGQFYFFGTGWWGVPSFYFWLVAQSMNAFGDNLFGARMIHALAGIATVWFVYRTGRVAWSPAVGIVAAVLVAGSDFAIQFSRTAGESTITLFTWTVCFYYLYKGLKTRKPSDFVLSGLAAGFTLYGYASGKLLPVFLALIAVYLLLRWGLLGLKRYFPGLALLAIAALLTWGPNALFIVTQKPSALTERSNGVALFAPNNWAAASTAYGTGNPVVVVGRQFGTAYSAFDVGRERGPFYPTNEPLLPVPWAALWVLGTAYAVWRAGDARYGVLLLWLVGGLAGAALTNDTPTMQRVVGMVPTLGLVPALFIGRLTSAVAAAWQARRRRTGQNNRHPGRARGLRVAWVVIVAVIALGVTADRIGFYFGPYTAQAHWLEYSFPGTYAGALDPAHDIVYQVDLPLLNGDPSPNLFLAKDMSLQDIGNLSDRLPIIDNDGKNVHFLVSPQSPSYLDIVQSYYPGGKATTEGVPGKSPFMLTYEVTAQQIDAQRYSMARYGPSSGPLFEQKEERLGTSAPDAGSTSIAPPAWITYPTTASWSTGLVAPLYGTYKFELTAPGGGWLEIDGRKMLTATVGTPSAVASVVLARGVHRVKLAGALQDAQGAVNLQWGAEGAALQEVDRRFLWGGSKGALAGTGHYPQGGETWFTTPDLAPGLTATERLDGFLAFRDIDAALGSGPRGLGQWKGGFTTQQTGDYAFDLKAPGQATLWIDDRLVAYRNLADPPPGATGFPAIVSLRPGAHTIEVRYLRQDPARVLELYWQPPGKEMQLFRPEGLLAPATGAWTAAERPNVPAPPPNALATTRSFTVRVSSRIQGNGQWQRPLGLAVLPSGRLALGDSGNGRLLVLGPGSSTPIASWSGPAGSPDGFQEISDVAVGPDGSIAVLDAEHGDIRIFDGQGKLLSYLNHDQIGGTHSRGLAWGADGKLYVADTGASRVTRYSRDGTLESVLKQTAPGLEPLEQPTDVAVGPDGAVYAVDLRGRVLRFGDAGTADRSWIVPIGVRNGGSHLAFWGDQLAITNPDSGTISVLDLKSGVVRTAAKADGPLVLASPTGVSSGPDGRLYVLETDSGDVAVLERASR